MKIYLLWHVHHRAKNEDGSIRHFDADGTYSAFEEKGDDIKLLGAYSSRERAEHRIEGARCLPGFRDEPLCFWIDEFVVDVDHWTHGFSTPS